MSRITDNLVKLADCFAAHSGVGHHAISMRIRGKGDFFQRLKNYKDCQTQTAEAVLDWFDSNWPRDLEWPADITRPSKSISKQKDDAA